MQNEEETPKPEAELARKMVLSAIKGEPLGDVLLNYTPNQKQAVYAIAIGICAQMDEKEALRKIMDDCPPDLLQATLFEAMLAFAKNKIYNETIKRIQEACSPDLLQSIISKAIIEFAENNTTRVKNIINTVGLPGLVKSAFARAIVDKATDKKAFDKIMSACPKDKKAEVLNLAINLCRELKKTNLLIVLTHELSMVRFDAFIASMQHKKNERKRGASNSPSSDNDSRKKPSPAKKP